MQIELNNELSEIDGAMQALYDGRSLTYTNVKILMEKLECMVRNSKIKEEMLRCLNRYNH